MAERMCSSFAAPQLLREAGFAPFAERKPSLSANLWRRVRSVSYGVQQGSVDVHLDVLPTISPSSVIPCAPGNWSWPFVGRVFLLVCNTILCLAAFVRDSRHYSHCTAGSGYEGMAPVL